MNECQFAISQINCPGATCNYLFREESVCVCGGGGVVLQY